MITHTVPQRTSRITGLETKVHHPRFSDRLSVRLSAFLIFPRVFLHCVNRFGWKNDLMIQGFFLLFIKREKNPVAFWNLFDITSPGAAVSVQICSICVLYESCYMASYILERLSMSKGFPCCLLQRIFWWLSSFLLGKFSCWQSVPVWHFFYSALFT